MKTLKSLLVTVTALAALACTAPDEKAGTVVVLSTELGDIEIEVYDDRAPVSAGSFLDYLDAGLYEGAAFYRTVMPANDHGDPPISVIQGGLLGADAALPPVSHETTADTGILHTDGVISLARGEPGTGSGGAFFICIGDQPGLDYGGLRNPDGLGFAAFGRVIQGMDVVHAIHQGEAAGPGDSAYTAGQMLTEPVVIESASRRFGTKPAAE